MQLTKQIPTGRGEGFFFVWHVVKTIAALKAAGYEPIQQVRIEGVSEFDSPCKPLTGPFAFAISGDGGLIQNRDGQTVFWSIDRAAKRMTAVLQLAYEHRAKFLDNDWEAEALKEANGVGPLNENPK